MPNLWHLGRISCSLTISGMSAILEKRKSCRPISAARKLRLVYVECRLYGNGSACDRSKEWRLSRASSEYCLFERPEQALCLIERLMLDKGYWTDISENVKVRAARLRPAKVAESFCQAFQV